MFGLGSEVLEGKLSFVTLIDFQLGAHNFYLLMYNLLKSSTCFEYYPAHLQEVYVNCIHAASGIVTVCR
jgi:hypothetical protein